MPEELLPGWTDQPTIILATGPSAQTQNLDLAEGLCRVIAVKNSWLLATWAEVLFAAEPAWWAAGLDAGYTGRRMSHSVYPGVELIDHIPFGANIEDDHILAQMASVGSVGQSSGFQALNLAAVFGATSIALVGFDCRVDLGSHWHGDYDDPTLPDPTDCTAYGWQRQLDKCADALAAMGLTITNCSPGSTLKGFPQMDLIEWLGDQDFGDPE